MLDLSPLIDAATGTGVVPAPTSWFGVRCPYCFEVPYSKWMVVAWPFAFTSPFSVALSGPMFVAGAPCGVGAVAA